MAFEKAVRKALPVFVALTGGTTSGKTLGALLLARGLVGPKGKIVGICTERGRMSLFANNPEVGEFYVDEIHPPFIGERFIDKIVEAQEFGADAIIIDSGSHEWNGLGGASDQAADIDPTGAKGFTAWRLPKRSHKRFMNNVLNATCHVIVTLRGSYPLIDGVDRRGNAVKVPSPVMVPEQEKNFLFDMTFHALLETGTHIATWVKMPQEVVGKLEDGVITPAAGSVIRKFVENGTPVDLKRRAAQAKLRDAADEGTAALVAAWQTIPKALSDDLRPIMTGELKSIADAADLAAERARLAAAELEGGGFGGDDLPVKTVERFPDDDGPVTTETMRNAVGGLPFARTDGEPSFLNL